MKIGKLPESVLKRSVFKQIHTRRPEVVLGAGVGEDCAAIKLAEDETLVMSTDPITGTAKDIGWACCSRCCCRRAWRSPNCVP